jgi:hypothetical protein
VIERQETLVPRPSVVRAWVDHLAKALRDPRNDRGASRTCAADLGAQLAKERLGVTASCHLDLDR